VNVGSQDLTRMVRMALTFEATHRYSTRHALQDAIEDGMAIEAFQCLTCSWVVMMVALRAARSTTISSRSGRVLESARHDPIAENIMAIGPTKYSLDRDTAEISIVIAPRGFRLIHRYVGVGDELVVVCRISRVKRNAYARGHRGFRAS
jgi:hypothetical protein